MTIDKLAEQNTPSEETDIWTKTISLPILGFTFNTQYSLKDSHLETVAADFETIQTLRQIPTINGTALVSPDYQLK